MAVDRYAYPVKTSVHTLLGNIWKQLTKFICNEIIEDATKYDGIR